MFTQKCFIKKNTPKIVKQLEKLGYGIRQFGCIDIFHDKPCLLTDTNGGIYGLYECEEGCIYCGTNDELFLAIAALRDDSDIDNNQVFIHQDGNFYKCECDSKIDMWGDFEEPESYPRKATVSELIELYKK